jgi:hypothetical protein
MTCYANHVRKMAKTSKNDENFKIEPSGKIGWD